MFRSSTYDCSIAVGVVNPMHIIASQYDEQLLKWPLGVFTAGTIKTGLPLVNVVEKKVWKKWKKKKYHLLPWISVAVTSCDKTTLVFSLL